MIAHIRTSHEVKRLDGRQRANSMDKSKRSLACHVAVDLRRVYVNGYERKNMSGSIALEQISITQE